MPFKDQMPHFLSLRVCYRTLNKQTLVCYKTVKYTLGVKRLSRKKLFVIKRSYILSSPYTMKNKRGGII